MLRSDSAFEFLLSLVAQATGPVARDAIAASRSLLENEGASTEELKSSSEALQATLHKVSEALYKAQAEEAEGGASPDGDADGSSGGDDGQVVDAEFTEES